MFIPLIVPKSQRDKELGLLPYPKPPANWGMYFENANNMHTLGMKYPIDIVFRDKNDKIISIVFAPPEHKKIHNSEASHVLELAPGYCRTFGIQVGQIVKLETINNKFFAHIQ